MIKFILVFFLAVSANAKSKSQDFELTVNFGEKVNKFELKNGSLITNGESKKVSAKNLDYVRKLVDKASRAKSNDFKLCTRTYMKLSMKSGASVVGCINSPNPTSKQLSDLANTLLIL